MGLSFDSITQWTGLDVVRYDNVVPHDTETSPLALHNGLVSVS